QRVDARVLEAQGVDERRGEVELAFLRDRDAQFRRVESVWQPRQQFTRAAALAIHELEEAGGGVEAVVEAEPAVAEEDVRGKLPTQQGAGFLHATFDVAVATFAHHRSSAGRLDQAWQVAAAFDVEDYGRAGILRQD